MGGVNQQAQDGATQCHGARNALFQGGYVDLDGNGMPIPESESGVGAWPLCHCAAVSAVQVSSVGPQSAVRLNPWRHTSLVFALVAHLLL